MKLRIVIAGSALPLTGCSGPQSALDPASPQAASISNLWWVFFAVACVVYVVVLAFTLISVRPGRVNPPNDAPITKIDPRRERRLFIVIGGAVGITIITLFGLLVVDLFANRALASLSSVGTNAVTIQITGRQWWWEVQYTDPTPSNYVTTANELHVPVGKPVMVRLASTDVIHSFWVPNLHGKKDLIPGNPATNWFRATRTGTFWGRCAEFCGYQHAQMRIAVTAEPEDKFNAWLNAQKQPAAEPQTESQKRGQQVFLSTTCVMCHTLQGTPAFGKVGPDLTHIASRPWLGAGARPNNPANRAAWIQNAQHIKPGVRMPQHNLSAQDLAALLDYLQILK
jgi:cytochrome c oxidase subunit II